MTVNHPAAGVRGAAITRLEVNGKMYTPAAFVRYAVYRLGADNAEHWLKLVDAECAERMNENMSDWIDQKIEWQVERLARLLKIEEDASGDLPGRAHQRVAE